MLRSMECDGDLAPLDAAELTYTPVVACCSAVDRTGLVVECSFKAIVYDNNKVFWEVRRILQTCITGNRQNFELSKHVKDINSKISSMLDVVGLDLKDAIKPSLKAP